MPSPAPAEILAELYRAAVLAADPGAAVRRALGPAPPRDDWVIAVGKAAEAMARAAVHTVRATGGEPRGGLIVAPGPLTSPPPLAAVAGEHPIPGPGSAEAARRLAELTIQVAPDHRVLVLISGGTSSLIAAPLPAILPDAMAKLFRLLLGSGLDIEAMNLIRKRFSRWGAGRLAAALAPAEVRGLLLSDVPGDSPAVIGSGPLTPDPSVAAEVLGLLDSAGLTPSVPDALIAYLAGVSRGRYPETPKPGDPAFAQVVTEIVGSNDTALRGVADEARRRGWTVTPLPPLEGPAAEVGRAIGQQLRRELDRPGTGLRCWLAGGETTVQLGGSPGKGGRSQELALAAAAALDGVAGVALLAAGTDGRDGPTDAAGAIVSGATWQRIRSAGRDPARDLAAHDAYRALDAAEALFRPGATGTNVMDLVIAIEEPTAPAG